MTASALLLTCLTYKCYSRWTEAVLAGAADTVAPGRDLHNIVPARPPVPPTTVQCTSVFILES